MKPTAAEARPGLGGHATAQPGRELEAQLPSGMGTERSRGDAIKETRDLTSLDEGRWDGTSVLYPPQLSQGFYMDKDFQNSGPCLGELDA